MKKVFISLISLAMLYSCSDKESSMFDKELSGNIKVHATIANLPISKGVVTGNSLDGINLLRVDQAAKDPVPVNFSSATTPLTGNLENGSINFLNTPPQYLHNNYYTYMLAYWPAGKLANNNITWDIDGKTDILLSNTWCAGNYTNPISTGMVFNHQLSRLHVICKAQNNVSLEAVKDTWGEITSIEMVGVKPQLQLNTTDKTLASIGSSRNVPLLQSDCNKAFSPITIPASDNAIVNAATMQAPIVLSESSYSFQLMIKTTKKTDGVLINVALKNNSEQKLMGFDAGMTHTVTLTFKSTDKVIEVSSTSITPWKDGYTGSNDVII